MSVVARIEFGCNLKVSTSAIGYYSYTSRCGALNHSLENSIPNYVYSKK